MYTNLSALMTIGAMVGASNVSTVQNAVPTEQCVVKGRRLRHAGNNKPPFDAEKRNRRNRIAKLSRRRNRSR